MGNTLQDDIIVSSPRTHWQLDGIGSENDMDMGTNTSDIEVRPQRDRTRLITLDANAQTSLPLVDVPSGRGDQVAMPHIKFVHIGV